MPLQQTGGFSDTMNAAIGRVFTAHPAPWLLASHLVVRTCFWAQPEMDYG